MFFLKTSRKFLSCLLAISLFTSAAFADVTTSIITEKRTKLDASNLYVQVQREGDTVRFLECSYVIQGCAPIGNQSGYKISDLRELSKSSRNKMFVGYGLVGAGGLIVVLSVTALALSVASAALWALIAVLNPGTAFVALGPIVAKGIGGILVGSIGLGVGTWQITKHEDNANVRKFYLDSKAEIQVDNIGLQIKTLKQLLAKLEPATPTMVLP